MLPLLLALVAATPSAAPEGLLRPEGPMRPPQARLLVAQVAGEARAGETDLQARLAALRGELREVDAQLDAVPSGWPVFSTVAVIVGAVVFSAVGYGAPLFLLGTMAKDPDLVRLGLVVTGVGLGGGALSLVGLVTGIAASQEAQRTRDALLRQRSDLLDALRRLEPPPRSLRPLPSLPVAVLRF